MSNSAANREIEKIIAAAQQVAQRNRFVAKSIATFGNVAKQIAVENAVAGKNVQGRPWKPLKKGGAANRWMAPSLELVAETMGFKVFSDKPYAIFHQRGAKAKAVSGPLRPGEKRRKLPWKLPKRTVLPKKGIPKPWKLRIVLALNGEWNAVWQQIR